MHQQKKMNKFGDRALQNRALEIKTVFLFILEKLDHILKALKRHSFKTYNLYNSMNDLSHSISSQQIYIVSTLI